MKWINDILEDRRIIVRHIQEDIYDGQILSEMLGQLELSSNFVMTIPIGEPALMTSCIEAYLFTF